MGTATKPRKVVRRRRPAFPLDVPVNVKVVGERTMRKNVVLAVHPDDSDFLVVRTGRRGRPSHLAVADVEKVRAL